MTSSAPVRRPIPVPPEALQRARLQLFSTMAKHASVDRPTLEQYFIDAWPLIEPATPLQNRWYIGYVAEHLEAVMQRQILRLAISIHPRSAKSNLVTILWPTHTWIEKAFLRWMFISYSQSLSSDHSRKRRRVIESKWYQEKWGALFQLQHDQNRADVFENTATGVMLATSASGTATGKGANIQVYDDFINPQEAESETERKAKIDAYSHTFSSRLNDPKNDAMVVLAQRTHSQDLTGHVLAEGGWTHVELPLVCEKRTQYFFPISRREHVREVGDILNPARHDTATIEKQKRASGSRAFSAQWMCAPSSDEGNMVKRHWWRFYKEDPRVMFAKMHVRAVSWDFAFKDLETSSFVVGLVGGRLGSRKYLFGEVRDHLDFVKTASAVQATNNQWPGIDYTFYEDKANGPAVKSYLTGKVRGMIPVETLGSKEARMATASPDIEAGDVMLPYPYDENGQVWPERQWVLDYIEELARFPEEPNDRGDATSQLIIKLNNTIVTDQQEDEASGSVLMNGDSGNDDLDEIDLGGIDMGFTGGWSGGDDGTL